MTFTTLVTASQLIGLPTVRVLDVRHDLTNPEAGRSGFLAGHIPGAGFLHLDSDLSGAKTGRNGRHPLPDPEVLAQTFAAAGISRDTQVVICDAQGGMFAARVWWMLRWLGHEAVAVLDGGWQAWLAAGGATETGEARAVAPGNFTRGASRVATRNADEVLANLATQQKLVVDARAADRFRGENETLDPVGGHIPGARNRFFKDNLAADGNFKSPALLRAEWLAVLGDKAPQDVIAQCGSGVTACHNLLALEVAGLPGAALYPGSWSEWCSDPSRPVASGAD
ncbi:sulfurtransferase [Viridibacterium curvum]|uniref:Sulfurtransferase n=1 Tax=Viridibacterium curvum TaxID=1101404 RepID=A0ABP9QPD9_9RHOO